MFLIIGGPRRLLCFCPHDVDGVVPGHFSDHFDRKPAACCCAMAEWAVDASRVSMIDNRSDDMAAAAAWTAGHRYTPGSLGTAVDQALADMARGASRAGPPCPADRWRRGGRGAAPTPSPLSA